LIESTVLSDFLGITFKFCTISFLPIKSWSDWQKKDQLISIMQSSTLDKQVGLLHFERQRNSPTYLFRILALFVN